MFKGMKKLCVRLTEIKDSHRRAYKFAVDATFLNSPCSNLSRFKSGRYCYFNGTYCIYLIISFFDWWWLLISNDACEDFADDGGYICMVGMACCRRWWWCRAFFSVSVHLPCIAAFKSAGTKANPVAAGRLCSPARFSIRSKCTPFLLRRKFLCTSWLNWWIYMQTNDIENEMINRIHDIYYCVTDDFFVES